jgi:hypothetical protein
MRLLNPLSSANPSALTSTLSVSASGGVVDASNVENNLLQAQTVDPPSNLLVIFLQSCSAILQETKMDNPGAYDTVKLFMLILVCISEDQYANSLLHDSNMLYSVFLYQAVGISCLCNFNLSFRA